MQLPKNYKLVYNHQQIKDRVCKLGLEITNWSQSLNSDLIGVPVLRGGLFFYADLVREINTSIELAPVRSWGYQVSSSELSTDIKVNLYDLDVNNRSVLLIDDLCDTGRTLQVLSEECKNNGAKEVKTAVLIKRHQSGFNPDYFGFFYDQDEWFVGYGMEDKERYRNLKDIYVIQNGS